MNCRHDNDCMECQDRDELRAAESAALRADNARLRALVAKGQNTRGVGHVEESACTWCDSPGWYSERPGAPRFGKPHEPDCPAFTPEGVVK